MELNTILEVKVEKNDRVYRFSLPAGAPFGESYDAVFEMLNKIREMANEALEKARREEPKEKAENKKGN